jgi:hypothetical protein
VKASLAGVGLWILATAAATGLVLLAVGQVSEVANSQPAVQPVGGGGPGDPTTTAVTTAPIVATTDVTVATTTTAPASVATTTTPATATTESYVLVGGVVAVSYSSTSVKVAWATPLPGYSVSTRQVSATRVEVEFTGVANRSHLDAWWEGGPRHTITNV